MIKAFVSQQINLLAITSSTLITVKRAELRRRIKSDIAAQRAAEEKSAPGAEPTSAPTNVDSKKDN